VGGFNFERFGRRWLNKNTFQQMHPTFWLNGYLLACSNKDDDALVEGPETNPEFDLRDEREGEGITALDVAKLAVAWGDIAVAVAVA
jgi:hypothetical protein